MQKIIHEYKPVFNVLNVFHCRRSDEKALSERIYEIGAERGVFMSKWQRSASSGEFHLGHLRSRPVWGLHQLSSLETRKSLTNLIENWAEIRGEALNIMNDFSDEDENLKRGEFGRWRQFVLYENGQKIDPNCRKAPKTCELIERFDEAKGLKRGQVKFFVLHPDTRIWPHTGPTNCRLRAHLGLSLNESDREKMGMKIADEKVLSWKEGEMFIIDDSFEHEVWFDKSGQFPRLILLVDFWHPDLTHEEKLGMSPLPSKVDQYQEGFHDIHLSPQ